MLPTAWVLAWLLSLAPLLLERGGSLDLSTLGSDSAPRTALCALAWLAIAGLPRPAPGAFCARQWWSSCMVSLPVLVLALALDLEAGVEIEPGLRCLLAALGMIWLSALAADLAKARPSARRAHAALWILGCLGLPLLAATLRWGPRVAGPIPPWSEHVARASPLDWAWSSVEGGPSPWAALAAMIALCALCAGLARETRA